jgi:hypothetical protein
MSSKLDDIISNIIKEIILERKLKVLIQREVDGVSARMDEESALVEGIELLSLDDFYEKETGDDLEDELAGNAVIAENSLDALLEAGTLDLQKYRNLLGAKAGDWSDEKLTGYLRRQFQKRSASKVYKSGPNKGKLTKTSKVNKKKLRKDAEFQTNIAADRKKFPYIHPSTAVRITDTKGREFDLDKLKSIIKQRPTDMLKRNAKIQHSGGKKEVFYNIGLPALRGLAVDEKRDQIVVVNTCPGAGECKIFCYAMKGGYIQYEGSAIKATRILNFLINDPSGFIRKLSSELDAALAYGGKKDAHTVVRWHDAGDMFSADYLDVAYHVANKFPQINFYAYTKLAGVAMGAKPTNFIMNFSSGAIAREEDKVDLSKTKHSSVVKTDEFDDFVTREVNPHMFKDLATKNTTGKLVRDAKNRIQFSPANLQKLKRKLANNYSIDMDTILTYDEVMDIPQSDAPEDAGKYNVIVRPGDGDDSAKRPDVHGTYLLIH